MGWRGVTRSLIAASRAAERERARRSNAIHRARRKVDSISDQLESELARDLEKVGQLDQRMAEKPVTFGEIAYKPDTRNWSSKRFADNTGAIRWSFALTFTANVTASGTAVDGCRTYELTAVILTRWCVLLAFKISAAGSGRSTKLLSKSNPSNNKIFLIADGTAYRAIDGDLDAQLSHGSSSHAVVAFPLPSEEPSNLAVELLLRSGPIRLQLPPLPAATLSKARDEPSLVDMVKAQFDEATAGTRAGLASAHTAFDKKTGSRGGWLWVLTLLGLLVLVGALSSGA